MKKLLMLSLWVGLTSSLWAQPDQQTPKKYEVSVLLGTIQPLVLDGGNVEVDLYLMNIVLGYSHGFSLEMTSKRGTTAGIYKDQSLAIHIPFTTGFGIGYRINKYVDVRIEPKLHKFEVYYDGADRKSESDRIITYRTITLGGGAYFRWKPFEKHKGFLNNITTATSIRYWPKISNSLEDGQLQYENRITGNTEVLKPANIGFANSPIILNVAIGYSFKF